MKSERYERVMAAIRREVPDRLPWALWGHFPAIPWLEVYSWEKSNRDGKELAKAHVALLTELDYKMDLLKVTPFYRFMAYRWGSKFLFKNNEESDEKIEVVVKEPEDWQKLWVLDPKKELREHVKAVSILSSEIGRRMPFIYSLPSPLVQALHHVSSPARVYTDMRENPDALKEGLEIITETCIDFSKACIDEGATGIFFGIGGGGDIWSKMSRAQMEEYGLGYDKRVLDVWADSSIRLLHICSNTKENPQTNGGLMEEGWFKKYPVDAINWWDASFTRYDVGKQVYGDTFCIVAGLDQTQTMLYGSPQQIEETVKQVIATIPDKGGFMFGPGCTLNQDTPLANYNAVGRAAEKFGVFKR